LKAESNELQYAVPGGLIGVGLRVDPTVTRGDKLVGQVLGAKGSLPDIFMDIEVKFYLLKKLLGVKTADGEKAAKVAKLIKAELLMANIGSTSVGARVISCEFAKDEDKDGVARTRSSEGIVKLQLTQPVCTLELEKVALSRRIDGHWRCVIPPPASHTASRTARGIAHFCWLPMIRQYKLSLSESQKRSMERYLYPMSGLMRRKMEGRGRGRGAAFTISLPLPPTAHLPTARATPPPPPPAG
jgi:hypothetical protein